MKSIFKSKTFWTNILAVGAMVIQGVTGFAVSPEIQATALAVINIILRSVTKEAVVWGNNSGE